MDRMISADKAIEYIISVIKKRRAELKDPTNLYDPLSAEGELRCIAIWLDNEASGLHDDDYDDWDPDDIITLRIIPIN